MVRYIAVALLLLVGAGLFLVGRNTERPADVTLLNVSYDPTRELYRDINEAFAQHWKEQTGQTVLIHQSHGGSGKQARAVIDGLDGDVVTLALAPDIDKIASLTGKIPVDWRTRLPHNSTPFTSVIVFLVRKGNPKGIHDWPDLVRPGTQVITPNPKTSGGARWNYLAAWGFALKHFGGDQVATRDFVTKLFKNVPVLDVGARGSTTTFAQRGIGDVLVTWENEAFLAMEEFGEGHFDLVVPSMTILAEPPVALVEGNLNSEAKRKAAQAYLDFLYSREGQRLGAKHHYRPTDPQLADPKDLAQFQAVQTFTIDDTFGSWKQAQEIHFDDNGLFDSIYTPNN